ncbi:MAG: TetR/AcrR family transcriptional regulator, partial [Schwartzia sp.]|nr:TetR/AcrR family transcriptional regulator [Schwartzia sp. (in: firmicutes)]
MPPRVKFQKEEIVAAALDVVRKKGIDAVTAREVAAELSVSPRPIFTWFNTMEQLKVEVFELAKSVYRDYIERGLAGPVPFLGVGQQYIRFAKEEPELYKLLFLTRPGSVAGGAMD